MVATYQVSKFWEVSILISNLASALKHETPVKVYTDITVKPMWNESGEIVAYQICTLCQVLADI